MALRQRHSIGHRIHVDVTPEWRCDSDIQSIIPSQPHRLIPPQEFRSMRAFQRTIRDGNSYTINTSSSTLRRRRNVALVIEGLESRVVLSSVSAHLGAVSQAISSSPAPAGAHGITMLPMDTGGTYSNQPSPSTDVIVG
jgi:hypothetical protein